MSIFKDLEDLKSEISDWWGKNKAIEILSYGQIDGEGKMVMISSQVCSFKKENQENELSHTLERWTNRTRILCQLRLAFGKNFRILQKIKIYCTIDLEQRRRILGFYFWTQHWRPIIDNMV